MPRSSPVPVSRSRDRASHLTLTLSLLLLVPGCNTDSPGPTAPEDPLGAPAQQSAPGGPTIIVSNAAELAAALTPANAGHRIHVRAGSYAVTQPLVVPDGATLEGEGDMQFDGSGLPAGFSSGSRTTLTMTANVPGSVLSLGNGAVVRRLAIEDLPGRAGNVIGVDSRRAGDRLSATIEETEIVNANAHGVAPQGPTGCGVTVLTLNPNGPAAPTPHALAEVTLHMTRTIIRSPAMGFGCGVFAFNFAPTARLSVTLTNNIIGGGIIGAGGVSRPDFVHDARTEIDSHGNLYRDDTIDPCTSRQLGWNLQGGAGTPVPLPNPGAMRNTMRFHSVDDRIEHFASGVLASGGRAFFGAPIAGPVAGNHMDLQMLGTTISTSACGGAPFAYDLRLAGAIVTDAAIVPGDGNTLRTVIRGVTGSGPRANAWANVRGPDGAQPSSLEGAGNQLVLVGSPHAFARTNSAITPLPGATFFTGGTP